MPDEKPARNKRRDFTTVPSAAIADTRLTALELRCLMVISLHDGRSLVRGSGGGCYARRDTLARLLHADIASVSRATSKLIKHGYVVRETQEHDRRRHTLRVRFDQKGDEPVTDLSDEQVTYQDELGDKQATNRLKVGDGPDSLNSGNHEETSDQYISLSEEIDFDESKEINSVETARFGRSETRRRGFSGPIGDALNGEGRRRKDCAEARLGSGRQASIKAHLPQNWSDLSTEAQVSRLEGVLAKLDGRFATIVESDLHWMEEWLESVAEAFEGEPTGAQAQRLSQELYNERAA